MTPDFNDFNLYLKLKKFELLVRVAKYSEENNLVFRL